MSLGPNTRSLFFPPTHLTLHLVTFSCSQNFQNPSKEEDLRRFQRLRQMRRRSRKPSQKKRTRTVLRSGNTVGISVCVGATQTCNFQIKYIFITSVLVFFEQTLYILSNKNTIPFVITLSICNIPDIKYIHKHNRKENKTPANCFCQKITVE